MAKFEFETAVGFMPQTDEGTYNAVLDGIAANWSYTEGLLLGDPSGGVRETGLDLELARVGRDKALIGSTFSRSMADFLRGEIATFDFVFPYVGNRASPGGAPVAADATPVAGLDALLQGAGLAGAAWGSGVGWLYVFGSPNPISALVYTNGNRLELLDCRCALEFSWTPGEIALCTATISVGSIRDHSLAALPTLTYGPQASISAPAIVSVAHGWGTTRGFSEMTLAIAQSFDDLPDSNQPTGLVKEQSDREVKITGTLYADDTPDKGYEYENLIETNQANLDPLSFTVGSAMTTGNPALATRITVPDPELLTHELQNLGTRAAYAVELVGRGVSGNDELELLFL